MSTQTRHNFNIAETRQGFQVLAREYGSGQVSDCGQATAATPRSLVMDKVMEMMGPGDTMTVNGRLYGWAQGSPREVQ